MRVTKHAQQRIAERNITVSELTDCITNGVYMVNKWDANKITVKAKENNLYVVMDSAKTVIITVFRKEI